MPSSYDRNFAVTAEVPLPAAVPNGSSITFPYPSGQTATSKNWQTANCVLADSNGNVYSTGFTVAYGASTITVTNLSLGTLLAGKRYRLQANYFGTGQTANDPATYSYDSGSNVNGIAVGPAGLKWLPQPARADSMFSKYGSTGFDFSLATGVTIGTTDLTSSVTNDFPRFSAYTRKCVLGATGTSQIRFSQFTPVTPDPTEKALSIDVYIENYVTDFAGASNAYIDIELSSSTTTAIGSNYSRWSYGATALKQGWNTLKIRQADTVSSTAGAGNLPTGVTHAADVGTGFNWSTETCGYVRLTFNNMPSQNVYVDQLRLPAKAKAVLVIGFDASAYGNADNTFVDKLAPLFARYGIRGYCTYTYIYELIFSGSTAWRRLASLYNDYGWDVINHTWSHGAGSIGRNTILTSLVSVSDVCTATFPSAHGLAIGSKFRARIRGSSISVTNVVSEWTVTTTTAATATITGAGSATATGTITINTFLGEVFSTDTAENRRQALHEFKDAADAMRATGFSRALGYTVYPNGSYCEKAVMEYAADASDIKIGRSSRLGYTHVNELGIDNPLACGAFEMTSGTSGTLTSEIEAKVSGAISRGDHIHIFGHFILDDTDPANAAYAPVASPSYEYPPANNGNPNPPSASLSSTGGWWYYSQLARLLSNTVGPAITAGTLVVMTPSEYVQYMGYKGVQS